MNINPFEMMKQMGAFQEKLANVNATGSAGGGMVEVDLNGKLEVIAVRIAKEAVEGGDTEMLEDLVMAAFSNALEKTKEAISRELGSMAAGLPGGIPGLL
ncbi:MAG: YbaB/EbfC family nucleoid-associated protein [Treponema sp.]|jgi:DNA-binding YbaB/EbfC family protein|nr:YbaB/EbfC family nucleoid-associated protein [Treponema sp.]